MDEDEQPVEHFTDEENAFLRHVRFGELPPRVPPEELVELVETDPRRDLPEHLNPDQWIQRYGAV